MARLPEDRGLLREVLASLYTERGTGGALVSDAVPQAVIEDWGLPCSHPCGLAATVGHLRPVSDQLGLVLGHSPKDSCGEAASGGRRVQVRIEDHQRPALLL